MPHTMYVETDTTPDIEVHQPMIEMPQYRDFPTPDGYRRVSWEEVAPGAEVYLVALNVTAAVGNNPNPVLTSVAAGPWWVLGKHHLKNIYDIEVQEVNEHRLLVKLPQISEEGVTTDA